MGLLLLASGGDFARAASMDVCPKWDMSRKVTERGIPSCEERIWMRGEIADGDYAKFRTLLAGPGKNAIRLILGKSPGGNLDETMKMGRLVRKLKLQTVVPFLLSPDDSPMLDGVIKVTHEQATCASACVVLWLSGASRVGNWRLVIHRPYYDSDYFGGLSVDEADVQYREMENEDYTYLRDMGTPEPLITKMRAVPSTEGEELDPEYVFEDLAIQVPSFDEWLTARCGRVSRDDPMSHQITWKIIEQKSLTKEEQAFLDHESAVNQCRAKAHIQAHHEAWKSEFE